MTLQEAVRKQILDYESSSSLRALVNLAKSKGIHEGKETLEFVKDQRYKALHKMYCNLRCLTMSGFDPDSLERIEQEVN